MSKETSCISEDVDVFLAIFDPSRARLATHNGYDVVGMRNRLKSIVVLKNRYGENQVEDACVFYGKINIWRELPKADQINDYDLFEDPNWTSDSFSQSHINSIINFKL